MSSIAGRPFWCDRHGTERDQLSRPHRVEPSRGRSRSVGNVESHRGVLDMVVERRRD